MSHRVQDEKGVALVIVLTVVALLTITVIEFASNVQLDHVRTRNSIDAMQSNLLARSGVNLVETFLAQDVDDKVDWLGEDWALALQQFCAGIQLEPTMQLRCAWEDESGKIDVNWTQAPRRTQESQEIKADNVFLASLGAMFESLGMEQNKIEDVRDYWQLDVQNSQGESSAVPPFESLEDFAAKMQIPPGKLKKMRRWYTAIPNNKAKKINPNTAHPCVLKFLLRTAIEDPGQIKSIVDDLVARRQEEPLDGGAVVSALEGAPADAQSALAGVFQQSSKYFRLEASGRTNVDPTGQVEGGIGQTLSVLVWRKRGLPPRNNPNGLQFSWTFQRLDWQKEAGARLFRSQGYAPLVTSDDEEEDISLLETLGTEGEISDTSWEEDCPDATDVSGE